MKEMITTSIQADMCACHIMPALGGHPSVPPAAQSISGAVRGPGLTLEPGSSHLYDVPTLCQGSFFGHDRIRRMFCRWRALLENFCCIFLGLKSRTHTLHLDNSQCGAQAMHLSQQHLALVPFIFGFSCCLDRGCGYVTKREYDKPLQ